MTLIMDPNIHIQTFYSDYNESDDIYNVLVLLRTAFVASGRKEKGEAKVLGSHNGSLGPFRCWAGHWTGILHKC